jgi:hypothetical protein
MKENTMQNNWQEEWLDMPEFVQEKQEPYAKIIIRFDNEKDLNDFSKLINQPLNKKTKSIWFPKLIRGINSNKRYIDES